VGRASRALGYSPQWTRILIDRGQLQAIDTPLGWLVDQNSVAAELEQRTARARRRAQRAQPSEPEVVR
jgi:hypothetical protein